MRNHTEIIQTLFMFYKGLLNLYLETYHIHLTPTSLVSHWLCWYTTWSWNISLTVVKRALSFQWAPCGLSNISGVRGVSHMVFRKNQENRGGYHWLSFKSTHMLKVRTLHWTCISHHQTRKWQQLELQARVLPNLFKIIFMQLL